ncbi:hypothetical protein [Paenarthrobacter sp. A20]|uniref:hypothetical protein n=1 Tax=Paenarthrobacter sp. A20 TaxID=2817891 RepID=UPI00209D5ABA|nr:hypothetical protein [Paenarthrobacter sp. A20]MCP1412218.1 hypothetical protein [Paenarthrobacter sp. A20]
MWRRSGLWTAAVAAVLLLGAAPAVAADGEASGWLELDAGPAGQVHRLTPGGSADWAVDVHVRGEPATSLDVGLQSEPASTEVLRDFLSVELKACSQPWEGSSCAEGQRVLLGRTSLDTAGGVQVDLMEPGSAESTNAYVLLTATLAEDVPREVQGSRTQIVVGVHGSGDDTGGPGFPGNPAGPSSGILADTGFRLGGFALLGFGAVAAGFGLARLRGAAG